MPLASDVPFGNESGVHFWFFRNFFSRRLQSTALTSSGSDLTLDHDVRSRQANRPDVLVEVDSRRQFDQRYVVGLRDIVVSLVHDDLRYLEVTLGVALLVDFVLAQTDDDGARFHSDIKKIMNFSSFLSE